MNYRREAWANQPAVIIASGTSLSDEQLAIVERAHLEQRVKVIAVNNTIERAPRADVSYWGDYTAIKHYRPKLVALTIAEWVTIDRAAAERWGLTFVKPSPTNGMSHERIHVNGNSGSQAICLAAVFGARRILLLGFDMQPGPDGRAHWFGQHPGNLVTRQLFDEWLRKAEVIARDAKALGVEVVNCTPGSAMRCFAESSIERELEAQGIEP